MQKDPFEIYENEDVRMFVTRIQQQAGYVLSCCKLCKPLEND